MTHDKARVGVLLSGRGSNFVALHEAMERGDLPAQIQLVISNRSQAPGLKKAAQRGIPGRHLPYRRRCLESDERVILDALHDAEIEWICLAGFMRVLSPTFIRAFPQRILNIHPSLLPAFPGLEAQQQALDYGVKITGCTVHLVDEGLDSGPIIHQDIISVRDEDTPQTLAARLLDIEHRSYPAALKRLLTEAWRIEGRRVRFGA